MPRVTTTRTIDLPRDALWTPLSDFPNIHKWSSGVRLAKATTAATAGLGAERRCDFTQRGYVQERVTKWDEGSGYDVDFTETDAPLKRAAAGLWLKELSNGKTQASFTIDYDMKMGPLGKLMDILMVRKQFAKNGAKVLEDLEKAARKVAKDPARK